MSRAASPFARVADRRALVVNHRDQVLKAPDRVRFPLVVKPNVGGSGAGIVRFATREDLVQRLDTLDFGPDGTALVQEYIGSTWSPRPTGTSRPASRLGFIHRYPHSRIPLNPSPWPDCAQICLTS